ncbi:hypothetical protein Q3G72_018760 [Acer saccharum]|nr:hypothetical protein Q3G72_018760 [Acer saccharum]
MVHSGWLSQAFPVNHLILYNENAFCNFFSFSYSLPPPRSLHYCVSTNSLFSFSQKKKKKKLYLSYKNSLTFTRT